MTDLNAIWQNYAAHIPGLLEQRPDFRFDPNYYGTATGLSHLSPDQLAEHHRVAGAAAGVFPTRYAEMISRQPGIADVLRDIVIDSDLTKLIEEEDKDAAHLAIELIGLGEPIDALMSNFSSSQYLKMYSDIASAKIDPIIHYFCYGAKEGRRNLSYVRDSQYNGKITFDKRKKTCLICIHEMSRTGAPIVGLDLAREAADTHNVIVSALRDGPLLEDFLDTTCKILITRDPFHDLDILSSEELDCIDFAILNSTVSWPYIPYVVSKQIPFASYLHEYSEYMHPAYPYTLFPLLSDLLVFSSDHLRDSWRDRLKDINFDVERDCRIIPQRPLFIGAVSANAQIEARQRLSKLIGRDLSKSRIVCGAGQAQWRKGTDVFAMAAQICKQRDQNTVFIWIGHGIQHDELGFGTYMAHHLKEIGAGEPGSNLFFIPAGPAYKDVLAASDVMFMSSRLDPLPNVVFDAVANGCRIVLFKGASGFTDDLYQASNRFITVEFGNAEEAVTEILKLPPKDIVLTSVEKPDFHLFETIASSLHDRLQSQRYFVCGASAIDEPIMYTSEASFEKARELERSKMLQYGRRRVWRDLDDVESELASSDNWVHRKLSIAAFEPHDAKSLPDFSLHIHAFYTDELADDLRSYQLHRHAKRIVVTTDTEKKAASIRKIMNAQDIMPEIVLVPNTGRDILPFMKLFEPGGAAKNDEYWCHIHQKKSLGSAVGGDKWRRFLLRILLGNPDHIANAVSILAREGTGLVAPFDPHYLGWDENRRLLPQFANRLPGPFPENPLLFPVGNMFWVRRSVVLAMNDFFGPDYPWPSEPIANDGTEYHLIERLWPAMAASLGLESVFVHKLDEKRV